MNKLKYSYLFAFMWLMQMASNPILAQVKGMVSLENINVVGADCFFDIYIKTTPNTAGDLLLAESDFVLNFNTTAFDNPEASKVANTSEAPIQTGYCTFVSSNHTDPSDFNTMLVRNSYYNGTLNPMISEDKIVINLNFGNAVSQDQLENGIAKIDGTETHCLGRFKVNGFNGTSTADLVLKTAATGSKTKLYTNTTDLETKQIVLETTNNLSLSLGDFKGQVATQNNILHWATMSEINSQQFVVERSINGKTNWTTIGEVIAAGHSTRHLAYRLVDEAPLATAYYRLRMVSEDGTIGFSDLVLMERKGIMKMEVYPIPATHHVILTYQSLTDDSSNVIMTDVLGKVVYKNTLETSKGLNQQNLDIQNLLNGIYFITLDTKTQQKTIKIVKK